MKLGPKQKRDHLYAFWKEKVKISTCCRVVLGAWFTLRDKLIMAECLCRPASNSVFHRIAVSKADSLIVPVCTGFGVRL